MLRRRHFIVLFLGNQAEFYLDAVELGDPRLTDCPYAQDAAINHGKNWRGFKLVESRTNRKYTDEEAVAQAAKDAGYPDIYKLSLITLTEMERLMGKKTFAEVLGALVIKPQGKPTLVPASDKRPALTSSGAKQDFTELTEEKEYVC